MPCQKSVSFDRVVRIRPVPSVEELSVTEREDSWYSTHDIESHSRRERMLVRKVSEIGKLRKSLRHEIGLESKDDKRQRRARIQNGKYSILIEQERQWDTDCRNPERLALVSSNISQESLSRARSRAMAVAEQIQRSQVKTSFMGRVKAHRSELHSNNSTANQRWSVVSGDSEPYFPRAVHRNLGKMSGLVQFGSRWQLD